MSLNLIWRIRQIFKAGAQREKEREASYRIRNYNRITTKNVIIKPNEGE